MIDIHVEGTLSSLRKLQESDEGGQHLQTIDTVVGDLRSHQIVIKSGSKEQFMQQVRPDTVAPLLGKNYVSMILILITQHAWINMHTLLLT